jgi:hypothetical protein
MKLVLCLVCLSLLSISGQAQPIDSDALNQYVDDFSQIGSADKTTTDISHFVNKLKQKEAPSSTFKFCRLVFAKTRQEFFRRYTQYASFGQTLNSGKYNCLTGTALYALLLDHFGIKYSIIETNYHIFLLANTDEGTVLFEATDPLDGFVTDPKVIAHRIEKYRRNAAQELPGDGKRYYSFTTDLYQAVSLSELRGLLHYNVSTEAYNSQNFYSAIDHLDQALNLYSSPRIAEFSTVLLSAILQSPIDERTKDLYISQLKSIRKKLPVMASRNYLH